jgi:hypothetical protein
MRALQSHALIASGIRAETGKRENIEPLPWLDLSIDWDNSAAVPKKRWGRPDYTDLRFKSERALIIWPDALACSANEPQPERAAPDPGAPQGKGKRGRKPGSGKLDESGITEKMLRCLAANKAPSIFAAAGQFADQAKGGATKDSKQRRLAREFGNRFGSEPPEGKTWADVECELNVN